MTYLHQVIEWGTAKLLARIIGRTVEEIESATSLDALHKRLKLEAPKLPEIEYLPELIETRTAG